MFSFLKERREELGLWNTFSNVQQSSSGSSSSQLISVLLNNKIIPLKNTVMLSPNSNRADTAIFTRAESIELHQLSVIDLFSHFQKRRICFSVSFTGLYSHRKSLWRKNLIFLYTDREFPSLHYSFEPRMCMLFCVLKWESAFSVRESCLVCYVILSACYYTLVCDILLTIVTFSEWNQAALWPINWEKSYFATMLECNSWT